MKAYELTGKHIYLPMGIVAVCIIVLLVLLAALYKELAPTSNARKVNEYQVTATCDILKKEEEHKGIYYILVLYISENVFVNILYFLLNLNNYYIAQELKCIVQLDNTLMIINKYYFIIIESDIFIVYIRIYLIIITYIPIIT